MIILNFNLRNPFSYRSECLANPSFGMGKNKAIELQFDRTTDIIGFCLSFTARQNHSGVFFSVALLGYNAIIHFYDTRHWDDENGCWYENDKDSQNRS